MPPVPLAAPPKPASFSWIFCWSACWAATVGCSPAWASIAAFKSLPLNLTLSATSCPWSFVVPCTCTGSPGIRDVTAICFLRAFKTPCTSSTSVVGVSKTTSLGVSTVCRVMVAPLRPLITPWTVWACIAALPATVIIKAARMAGIVETGLNPKLIFIGFLILMRCLLHALRYLPINDDRDTGKTTRESANVWQVAAIDERSTRR